MDIFSRYEIFKEIKASQVRKEYSIKPKEGKKCFIGIFQSNQEVQRIELQFRPSNLGKGWITYLLCPISLKWCKTLYLIDGVYQRNLNLKGFYMRSNPLKYYKSDFYKLCQAVQAKEQIEVLLSKPYFKPYYKGKLTKRYASLLDQAGKAGNNSMFSLINKLS